MKPRYSGGWATESEIKARKCRECGKGIVDPHRRTFCGSACVTAWKIKSDPKTQERLLRERDATVCVLCGLNCDAFMAIQKARWVELRAGRSGYDATVRELFKTFLRELSMTPHRWGMKRWWDIDHIVPVVEGGGSCGLENLRTLCWRCHQGETRKLAARRAEARRAAKKVEASSAELGTRIKRKSRTPPRSR